MFIEMKVLTLDLDSITIVFIVHLKSGQILNLKIIDFHQFIIHKICTSQ